jgi:RNA polymerase sigma-70 factor (ECF subfamily)
VLENEAILVRQAASEDAAFEVLYNYYFSQIYGYILKRIGRVEVTEDIVAEVFLKVFTKIKAYNPDGGTFRSWLFTVATNTMIDYCRKSSVRLEITPEEMPEKIDVSQDHMKIFQQLEDKVLIRNILDQLSVKYQKILHLKFFAELSHIEIAEIMNISPNNVGVLVHRALGKFEKLYRLRCPVQSDNISEYTPN